MFGLGNAGFCTGTCTVLYHTGTCKLREMRTLKYGSTAQESAMLHCKCGGTVLMNIVHSILNKTLFSRTLLDGESVLRRTITFGINF